jgi:hypothetical protein
LLHWLQRERSVRQVIDLLLDPRFRHVMHAEIAGKLPAETLS